MLSNWGVEAQGDKKNGYCTGLFGEVRNDLPRAVEKVGLIASFYNATDSLIGVKTFDFAVPNGPLQPGKPTKFKAYFSEFERNLPVGWKYRLEVIEAHYVGESR